MHCYDPRSSAAGDAISLLLVKQCFWGWFIGTGLSEGYGSSDNRLMIGEMIMRLMSKEGALGIQASITDLYLSTKSL